MAALARDGSPGDGPFADLVSDSESPSAVASWGRMLARGGVRHCPRCGAGHLFTRWFAMVERCPGCGYTFAREEGFFLGAFVINFGVTVVGLALLMGLLIAVLAGGGSPRTILAVAVAAAGEAVLVPILFYPYAKTLWSAIDLAMHRAEGWASVGSGVDGGYPTD